MGIVTFAADAAFRRKLGMAEKPTLHEIGLQSPRPTQCLILVQDLPLITTSIAPQSGPLDITIRHCPSAIPCTPYALKPPR